jgi:pimeloyl-ACP methyl ester carboxylesterase
VILLIMGLAAQLTAWPPQMIETFNQAGFRTIRFDNRDSGLSDILETGRAPNLILQVLLRRLRIRGLAPYNLADMAADAAGLLSALNIRKAHVVGVSMGGMIAQILTATRPEAVASMTTIMSSTNNPRLPGPRSDIARLLLRPGPAPKTEAEAIERSLALWQLISTPGDAQNDDDLRAKVEASIRRAYRPSGTRRQTAAIVDTGDLRRWTQRVSVPTLVIHGDADPLVPCAGSRDIYRTIPNARLEIIEGMAHDLPQHHLGRIIDLIVGHARPAA